MTPSLKYSDTKLGPEYVCEPPATYRGFLPDLSTDERSEAWHARCQAIAARFNKVAPPKPERKREWTEEAA